MQGNASSTGHIKARVGRAAKHGESFDAAAVRRIEPLVFRRTAVWPDVREKSVSGQEADMHPDILLGRRTMIGGSQAPMTRRSREPARSRWRKARQRWCSPMSPMPASSCHATCQVNRKVTVVAELRGWPPSPPVETVHQHRPGIPMLEPQHGRRPMIRHDVPGSVWANVVAILSVAETIGALYLPLVVH